MNNNDEAKAAMEALSGKELPGTLVINEARARQQNIEQLFYSK